MPCECELDYGVGVGVGAVVVVVVDVVVVVVVVIVVVAVVHSAVLSRQVRASVCSRVLEGFLPRAPYANVFSAYRHYIYPPPALLRIPLLFVFPIFAKQFHRHYDGQPALLIQH